jgi:hypothetical protein
VVGGVPAGEEVLRVVVVSYMRFLLVAVAARRCSSRVPLLVARLLLCGVVLDLGVVPADLGGEGVVSEFVVAGAVQRLPASEGGDVVAFLVEFGGELSKGAGVPRAVRPAQSFIYSLLL